MVFDDEHQGRDAPCTMAMIRARVCSEPSTVKTFSTSCFWSTIVSIPPSPNVLFVLFVELGEGVRILQFDPVRLRQRLAPLVSEVSSGAEA